MAGVGDSSSGGKLSVWVMLRLLAAWAASDDAVVDEVADRVHHLPVTVALRPPTLPGRPAGPERAEDPVPGSGPSHGPAAQVRDQTDLLQR